MFQSPRHPRPLEGTQREDHQFFVIKDPTQAFCSEDFLEVYKDIPTLDQIRQIHPRIIGDPTSGTDFEPRHRRRHLHHHQRHGRTQESRFARMRVRANFAPTIFGVEVLNVDKKHVLEFGIIRSATGFKGGKLPKSCSPILKDCTISHSGRNERLCPQHHWARCLMGYLKTSKVD